MRYLVTFLLCIWSHFTLANPVCLTDSDIDGDGWGWEQNQSCVIATTTECVDSDGDGWGWDGVRSCLVTPPGVILIDERTVCEDTGLIGDTWGWNGITSCRLAPMLTGGDTTAIAGLWDNSEPEIGLTGYWHILENGFITQYTRPTEFSDCFVVEEGIQDGEGSALTPFGGNHYQIDAYYFESSFTDVTSGATYYEDLVVTSYVTTIYIDSFGALVIQEPDFDDRDLDGDLDEIITVTLPAVEGVDLQELSVCGLL